MMIQIQKQFQEVDQEERRTEKKETREYNEQKITNHCLHTLYTSAFPLRLGFSLSTEKGLIVKNT